MGREAGALLPGTKGTAEAARLLPAPWGGAEARRRWEGEPLIAIIAACCCCCWCIAVTGLGSCWARGCGFCWMASREARAKASGDT